MLSQTTHMEVARCECCADAVAVYEDGRWRITDAGSTFCLSCRDVRCVACRHDPAREGGTACSGGEHPNDVIRGIGLVDPQFECVECHGYTRVVDAHGADHDIPCACAATAASS